MCVVSNGFRPIERAGVLRRALQYAKPLGVVAMVHAEDASLSANGVLGESEVATRLGLAPVPPSAEIAVVARDLEIVRETGGRLHFSHLTCARSVELVRVAKQHGVAVTCDVTPHHLSLDVSSAEGYSLQARVWPPLRTAADRAALRAGLLDGTIDAIASDHRVVDSLEQEHAFEACTTGLHAYGAWWARVASLGLTPSQLARVTSIGPAQIAGLGERTLGIGAVADVVVVDPAGQNVYATIASGELRSLEGRTVS
ncbi:MAG: amidohydrolase family protein [Archangium sp.]|nr:amidohydrolase family protein [Archangium sp.]